MTLQEAYAINRDEMAKSDDFYNTCYNAATDAFKKALADMPVGTAIMIKPTSDEYKSDYKSDYQCYLYVGVKDDDPNIMKFAVWQSNGYSELYYASVMSQDCFYTMDSLINDILMRYNADGETLAYSVTLHKYDDFFMNIYPIMQTTVDDMLEKFKLLS